jgi:hypothetical protein
MVFESLMLGAAGSLLPLLVILIVWSSVWKAFALWRAAGNKSLAWYIVLFILNTAGILEILYLFVFSKPSTPGNKKVAIKVRDRQKH